MNNNNVNNLNIDKNNNGSMDMNRNQNNGNNVLFADMDNVQPDRPSIMSRSEGEKKRNEERHRQIRFKNMSLGIIDDEKKNVDLVDMNDIEIEDSEENEELRETYNDNNVNASTWNTDKMILHDNVNMDNFNPDQWGNGVFPSSMFA